MVTHLTDVQRTLEGLHPLCHPRTRIFVYSYSRLWQPLLRLAEVLGLKYRQPPEAWLPPEEIENMLSLADFEVVRDDRADRLSGRDARSSPTSSTATWATCPLVDGSP